MRWVTVENSDWLSWLRQ